MERDGRGCLAETRLDGIMVSIALRVDMKADDNFAAVALLELGSGIDEVLCDVFLGKCVTRNGFRCRDLRFHLQPNRDGRKRDDES